MADRILSDARAKQMELVKRREQWRPLRIPCPQRVSRLILCCLDFRARTRFERVCRFWQEVAKEINSHERRAVWLYVIFRKGHLSGHERLTVSISTDGPIFWSKLVAYIYCCSCHYNGKHEIGLMGIMSRLAPRVNRLCLVDSPIDYAFLPDSFFWYVTNHCPALQFIYVRELDLEHLNYGTVKALAKHPTLKKLIVHQCRKFEVLQDFGQLPQLYVVKGEIQGLKALLGDLDSLTVSSKGSMSSVVEPVTKNYNGNASVNGNSSSTASVTSATNGHD